MKSIRHAVALPVLMLMLGSCGGDPSSPAREEVVGTYAMTALSFDPQGVLPEVQLLGRLAGAPSLILAPAGQAQLVFQDPATGLFTVADGTYTTPQGGVRLDFGATTSYRNMLMSQRMTFDDSGTGVLSFNGPPPDGVDRARLVQLVPEYADEQLLDPVPGVLVVVFTRVESGGT